MTSEVTPMPQIAQLQVSPEISHAFDLAFLEAEKFRGQTNPNPPVGAAALDAQGAVLGVNAHRFSGESHAEAGLIENLKKLGKAELVDTVVITLEPCNHFGRTPPCSEALIRDLPRLKRVFYAQPDPNQKVSGGGPGRLRQSGIQCELVASPAIQRRGLELIAAFWVKTQLGRPLITVKTVHRGNYTKESLERLAAELPSPEFENSMIPPEGQATFGDRAQLEQAHLLRRRADLILTGSGTVLADQPSFTVRYVDDFKDKKRKIWVLDRRDRVRHQLPEYFDLAAKRGFEVLKVESEFDYSLPSVFGYLSRLSQNDSKFMEVLVEAGPRLTKAILLSGFYDLHVVMACCDPNEKNKPLSQTAITAFTLFNEKTFGFAQS